MLATVPGIQATTLDISSGVTTNFFTARGGRGNEGTIQIDGMNVGSAFNGGGVAGLGYPSGESSEVQVTLKPDTTRQDASSCSSFPTSIVSSSPTARTVSGWLRSTPARASRFIG